MASLVELFQSGSDDLRNRITAAGWNKAKGILQDAQATDAQLGYARQLFTGSPNASIIHAVMVLLQDEAEPTDAQIQGAVETAVDKFAALGV